MLKKGKKGHNIYKFVEKCTKFENILKRSIIACKKLLQKALKTTASYRF